MHAQVHTRAGRPVRSSLTLACRLVGFARFFFFFATTGTNFIYTNTHPVPFILSTVDF